MQHPLHPAPTPHHPVPSLLSNHGLFSLPGSSAATALLIQRTNEEEKWLARQRRLRQEKEDRQSQVSEFRQQVLEQHLDMGRPPAPAETEHRPESARWGRAPPLRFHFAAPAPATPASLAQEGAEGAGRAAARGRLGPEPGPLPRRTLGPCRGRGTFQLIITSLPLPLPKFF